MKNFLRILFHALTCRGARWAAVNHTSAGRIYECLRGFAIWEAFS